MVLTIREREYDSMHTFANLVNVEPTTRGAGRVGQSQQNQTSNHQRAREEGPHLGKEPHWHAVQCAAS